MADCYYFAYLETYQAVQSALRNGNADELARIGRLIEQHQHAMIRQCGSIAIDDARAGRPKRSPEHLRRLVRAA